MKDEDQDLLGSWVWDQDTEDSSGGIEENDMFSILGIKL